MNPTTNQNPTQAQIVPLHPSQWVTLYRALGWSTLRVQACSKKPVCAWNAPADEPADFAQYDNIGVRLGALSNGLIDLDLDCREAVELAPVLLPPTWTFGRPGKPRSHYIYIASSGAQTSLRRLAASVDAGDGAKGMLCELRASGAYTVFPGSWHETGEFIQWEKWDSIGPATLSDEELKAAFGRLAVACIVARRSKTLGGNIHDLALALAGALWRSGWTLEDAEAVLLPALELGTGADDNGHRAQAIIDTWDESNDRNRYGKTALAELLGQKDATAFERAAELVGGTTEGAYAVDVARDGRPTVLIEGDLAMNCENITSALASVPPESATIFRAGGYVGRDGKQMKANLLARKLSEHIAFMKPSKGGPVSMSPDNLLVERWASDLDPRIPELRGRWRGPLLRPDGSVRTERGYDEATLTWVEGWDDPLPEPTRENALEAVKQLLRFVEGVGWVDETDNKTDETSWLAHVLTVAARIAITGPTPVWIYTATSQGSGKTTLARLAGAIGAAGNEAIVPPDLSDEIELARRLAPFVLGGGVVLDNMRGVFRSPALEGAVTSGSISVRPLYAEELPVPLQAVLSVTSNGAQIGQDWHRRSLAVQLKSAPLNGSRELRDEVRPWMTSAAVTIVRAFLLSDAKPEHDSLRSFAEWSRVIGGCIAWLGRGDIVKLSRESIGDLEAADEDSTAILDEIESYAQGREFTADELYQVALGSGCLGKYPSLNRLVTSDNLRTPAMLGKRLQRLSDATREIQRAGRVRGKRHWIVASK